MSNETPSRTQKYLVNEKTGELNNKVLLALVAVIATLVSTLSNVVAGPGGKLAEMHQQSLDILRAGFKELSTEMRGINRRLDRLEYIEKRLERLEDDIRGLKRK